MILLRVLNDCSISTANARITPSAKLLFSLGFYLIFERGKLIPRDLLASLLWPNVSSRSARHSLRRALWQLRRDGFPLANDHDMHVFLPKDTTTLDIDTFINTADDTQLTQPLNLLPWIPTLGSAQFHDWVDDVRYIINTRVTLRLNAAASQAKSNGDWQTVLRLAERTLEIDPECSIARTNAAQARQTLQTQTHTLKRPRLLFPADVPLRAVALLGESKPPHYHDAHNHAGSNPIDAVQHTHARNTDLTLVHMLLDNTCNNMGTSLHLNNNNDEQITHFLNTVASNATARGALVITTTLLDHHVHTQLAALAAMIPALQNAPGAAGCDPTFTQHLSQLLAHPTEADASQSLPPAHTILPALVDLISAVADEQPLILVVRNVHFADATSLSILTTLASHIANLSVLLILTAYDDTTKTSGETTPTPITSYILQLCANLERALTNVATSVTLHSKNAATMLSTLRDVEASLHASSSTPHDDLELLTLATLQHTERHWLPIANCAYECIAETDAPPHHRLEAGTLLCTLAAAMGDATLIHDAQRALHTLTAQLNDTLTIPQLKFQTLSNALLGPPSVAIQAAHALLTLARQTQRSPDLLNTLLLAGNTLHTCGTPELASGIYLEMFSRATRDKWLPHAMQASRALTQLSLDLGNLTDAQTWCDRMMSFASSIDSLWEHDTSRLLQLRVALAHKDIALATQLFTPILPLLTTPLLSVQASARASHLRLLILQDTPHPLVEQKAEELIALSRQLRTMRIFHYEFFSLYLALTFIGNETRGKHILQDYLEASQTVPLTPTPRNDSTLKGDSQHKPDANSPMN